MSMSRRERDDFIAGLIKAAAVPLAVGVVLSVMLLYDSNPRLLTVTLESIRGALHWLKG